MGNGSSSILELIQVHLHQAGMGIPKTKSPTWHTVCQIGILWDHGFAYWSSK